MMTAAAQVPFEAQVVTVVAVFVVGGVARIGGEPETVVPAE